MTIYEIIMVSIGLSMDAFAVSICKGLSLHQVQPKHYLSCGLLFGFFQGFMTWLGYKLGSGFQDKVGHFAHILAFLLLAYIGMNMIKEAKEEKSCQADFSLTTLLPLAIATSIDAFAVGITIACLHVSLITSILFISTITFVISCLGVKIGHVWGMTYQAHAQVLGGLILILIGIKMLLEHLHL